MCPDDTPQRRIYWTSGNDEIKAMNRLGRDKPVCADAINAHTFIEAEDDALYCITIERFPLDQATVMQSYLETINKEGER